jgi:SAM-dependent methyltransferase
MVRRWVEPSGKRILDVGCGIGMYTAAFQQVAAFVTGVEVEHERAVQAREGVTAIVRAVGEELPFETDSFEIVFSHEVLEHVADDRLSAAEMVRVARPGGHVVIFVPNRLYPFETHGIFWRGAYHFGNIPLVNYLPDRLRNRLTPHVRAYTARSLRQLFAGLPVRAVHHTRIYPGYDKLAARSRLLARFLRVTTYVLENTPLRAFGLSHFLVLEVLDGAANQML